MRERNTDRRWRMATVGEGREEDKRKRLKA